MGQIGRITIAFWLAAVLGACGGGSGGGSTGTTQPSTVPLAVISATAHGLAMASASNLQVAVGSAVVLDGSGSSSKTGTIKAYAWTISSKPANSTAVLGNVNGASATFTPDLVGSFILNLQVTDNSGATASSSLTLNVTASMPLPGLTIPVSFPAASSSFPSQPTTLGAVVTLDASTATYPAGTPVTLSFQLFAAPAGSAAALTVTGAAATFTADVTGQYQVKVHATNSSGAAADSVYVVQAAAATPAVAVAVTIATLGGSGSASAAVSNLVTLTATPASIPAGDGVSSSWTIVSKPATSTLTQPTVASGTPYVATLVPDVAGAYVVRFSLQDTTTSLTTYFTMNLNVVVAPSVVVTSSATPVAQANGPTFVAAPGVPVTLHGGASYDPGGGTLTYAWAFVSRPTGSTASFVSTTAADATFTPDLNGSYVVQLTVTTAQSLSASEVVTVSVGALPPVVIVDRPQISLVLGATATASAALSYDPSGHTLTYHWSVDSRPAGSAAQIASPNVAGLSFVPDVAGRYHLSVTVGNGTFSSIGSVDIQAVGAAANPVALAYTPLYEGFSRSLGRIVIASTTPDLLHILDPVTGTDTPVVLPAPVKYLELSPGGKLAAVLHEGSVSLVDLQAHTLVHTTATGGSQTDAFVSDSGLIYATGQTGGQWVTPAFLVVDGSTGATLQTINSVGNIYGTTFGVLASTSGRIFTLSNGLSPAQIYYWTVDPTTGLLGTTVVGSPYWGNYAMSNPMWLSGDQSLLFTSSGTYFHVSDLTYGGTLGTTVYSLSHSATASEAVAFAQSGVYASGYKRYLGSLLTAAPDVPLSTIGGAQTYGIAIFHQADDTHAIIVQTGSATPLAAGVQYYVIIQ